MTDECGIFVDVVVGGAFDVVRARRGGTMVTGILSESEYVLHVILGRITIDVVAIQIRVVVGDETISNTIYRVAEDFLRRRSRADPPSKSVPSVAGSGIRILTSWFLAAPVTN